ncbi:MAG: hypothetical protein IIX95_05965 [Clostridiales bacterium]|nr:hypothetical protein [Clostridiales bacterium]
MADDDLVCVKCGTKVKTAKDDLIDKLVRYKQLLSECEELKTMMKPQNSYVSNEPTVYKTRSFMRYFWPFLVGAVVGGYLIYMLSSVIIVATVSSDYSQATASSVLGDAFIGLILALIVAVAIAFIGVKISKSKQAAFNSNAEYMMRQADERRQAAQDNQKILNVYQENVTEMHLYEHLVPEQYRTSAKVGTIIDLLKEDKAETVEEACSLFG